MFLFNENACLKRESCCCCLRRISLLKETCKSIFLHHWKPSLLEKRSYYSRGRSSLNKTRAFQKIFLTYKDVLVAQLSFQKQLVGKRPSLKNGLPLTILFVRFVEKRFVKGCFLKRELSLQYNILFTKDFLQRKKHFSKTTFFIKHVPFEKRGVIKKRRFSKKTIHFQKCHLEKTFIQNGCFLPQVSFHKKKIFEKERGISKENPNLKIYF